MLYLFGDESHNSNEEYFGIGYLITPNPKKYVQIIDELRDRYSYRRELKFSNTDYSQALFAIRLLNIFFEEKDIFFKLIIKDRNIFSCNYFKNNVYRIKAEDMAYVQTYQELTKSIRPDYFNETEKFCILDEKPHTGNNMLKKYITDKDKTVVEVMRISSKERRKDDSFTGSANLVQLADFLTSLALSFCYDDNDSSNKYKKIYRKELCYLAKERADCLLDLTKKQKSVYIPTFGNQKINIFYWQIKNALPDKPPSKSQG